MEMGPPASRDETTDVLGAAPSELPQVWVLQPAVKHYRLPLWDQLSERAAGRYQLRVFGPLDLEHPDIESRPYLQEMPLRRRMVLGRQVAHWPAASAMIKRQQPEVVVLTASVGFLGSWTLPRVARRAGAAVIGWSKVNPRSGHTTWAQRRLKRRFFRRFDLFLCYGHESRDELAALGYPASRIRIAQNTIDTHRIFAERELIAARGEELRRQAGIGGKKILLCVGRMIPQKRHADLITAWLDLRQVDPELVLVFVGTGELHEGLKIAAEETDPERIIFTGAVPEGDDYAWIATSDVVVIPGAIGLALNQAMAFGKPTIIADEPGADAEMLRHGETGWRYPRGDIEALTRTVTDVLLHPDEARAIAAAAQRTIRQEATIERMVDVIDRTLVEGLEIARQRRSPASDRATVSRHRLSN
jgi:glycosyltransferase involved in cell wall biosynthesis